MFELHLNHDKKVYNYLFCPSLVIMNIPNIAQLFFASEKGFIKETKHKILFHFVWRNKHIYMEY